MKILDYFPESGSRKHFQASRMRAIDFSHKITPRKVIFAQIQKKNFFGNAAESAYLPPLKDGPINERSLCICAIKLCC